ncbi:MAG: penicillin-binding protein [Pseudomonadota bacterium]|jgi:penicillin-binding protein 1C
MRIESPRLLFALALLAAIIATLAAVRLWPKPPLASRYTSSVGVYDARGQLLRLTLAKDDRYRLWLPLDSISPDLAEAFLLQEDRWFYAHPGINPLSLLRGGWRTYIVREPRQGGSTITMQLARLIDANTSRSLGGKIRQIARALQLELMYSKHDILEAYLNLVPFGGNIEGVGAASLIHFGKATQALSLPEIMTLAVIPQSPAKRSLIRDGKGGQGGQGASLMDARRRLFERWCARHPAAASQAGLMTLPLNLRLANQLPFLAPHLVNQLLARDEGSAREIHTTLNLVLQRTLERQVRQYVERHRAIGIDNAAAILVDTQTLEVKALVGSANFHDALISGQVNGTLAKRSPGSTLKPFIYALAMDQGLIHPLSVLKDAPTSFGPFSPENFDGTFAGPITAHDALIRSRNVPAVALSSRLSAPSLYDFLKQAGVSRMLDEKHYGLSLALGGGDVTMEELVMLYAMLANRGVLRPLKYLRGAAKPAANDSGLRLLSEEASFMTLDMLRDNPRPEGTLAGARVPVPVAWKTGTSWGFRDAWSVGVFGQYVLAVWIGRFDGEGNPAYVGVQAAAPLFFQIVDAVAAGGSVVEPIFRTPPGLARVEVCAASGDLPNVHCPLKVESWFVPGKSPIRLSTVHRAVKVDKRTGRLACPPYDSSQVQEVVYEYWPSDLLRLFAQAGMPRRTPPAGECGDGAAGTPPTITNPVRGAAYVMRHARPEGNIVSLVATGEGGVDTLYWFVNDSYLAAARPGVAVQWTPSQAGTYLIRVLDPMGRADSREVIVTAEP